MEMVREGKSNAVVQTSCDVRDLAAAYEYFSEVVGDRPRNRSELVRMIIETFRVVLTSNEMVKGWDSVADADKLMKLAFGPTGMNPSRRRGSTLLIQKQLEAGVPRQYIQTLKTKREMSEKEKEALAERDAKDPLVIAGVEDALEEMEKELAKRDKEEMEKQRASMMLTERPKGMVEEKEDEQTD